MRLLAFSDLHRDLDGAARLVERSADADVVIAAGDFANQHKGLEETIEALKLISTPTILVPGNNETEDALRAACEGWEAATVLHGGAAEFSGTTFFGLGGGTPITPWDWSYDLSEDEARDKLTALPDGAVLITHSPPQGHVDEGLGSEAILEAIDARTPPVAVCGHIHSQWGNESTAGSTRILNLGPTGTYIDV